MDPEQVKTLLTGLTKAIKAQQVVDASNCPTFRGEPGEHFEKFLNGFNCFAQAHGWEKDTKRQWLPLLLKGYAVDFYEGLSQENRASFDTLVENLRARFPVNILEEAALNADIDRTQGEFEKVDQYANDILKHSRNFVGLDGERDRRLTQALFIRGLHKEIKEKMTDTYPSLERAIAPARVFEARLESCGKVTTNCNGQTSNNICSSERGSDLDQLASLIANKLKSNFADSRREGLSIGNLTDG